MSDAAMKTVAINIAWMLWLWAPACAITAAMTTVTPSLVRAVGLSIVMYVVWWAIFAIGARAVMAVVRNG